jgi:type IV pilus biogenesis/stability protein PilW
MSLIIDALKKAQQLRLRDVQNIPFFRSPQPSNRKKRMGQGKKWFVPILSLFCLFLILWIVGWNPFSSFQERKPPPPGALPEKGKPSPLMTENKPEEPAKVLPSSSQEGEKDRLTGELQETKKEEPLLGQIEKKQKPKTPKLIGRTVVGKPLPAPGKASTQPPGTVPPPEEKASLSSAHESREILKPLSPSPEVLTLFNQGVLFQNQKEAVKAIRAYQSVIELDPAYFEAYNNLGLLYQEIGNFDKAYQAYQKSIEINPRYEKALNNLGILLYLQDRYEEALNSFQKAISVHPENLETYLNLGILFKKQGQWDNAIDSFLKALAINPLHGETHYNMALLYEQMNQFDLAIDHFQKFIQLSSKTYPVLVSKVQRHLDTLSRMKPEKME